MAGNGFHYSIEAPEVWARAQENLARLAFIKLEPLHAEIGEYMVGETSDRFRDSDDPEGNKWAPLKRPRIRRGKDGKFQKRGGRAAKHGTKILVRTGLLRKSISYRADSTAAAIGSNLVYAARHNFGFEDQGGKVLTPQRQFLGIASRQSEGIVEVITDYLGDLVEL